MGLGAYYKKEAEIMNNIELYYKGLWAKTIKFFGECLLIIGLVAVMFSVWLTVLFMAIGIYLIFYGNALRFDYKMQSGIIVHKGDE